jgi:hypothetical protein
MLLLAVSRMLWVLPTTQATLHASQKITNCLPAAWRLTGMRGFMGRHQPSCEH